MARCWSYETARAVGLDIPNDIPKYDYYYSKYGHDQKIHFPVTAMEDRNSKEELQNIKRVVLEQLREMEGAPGMPFHHLPSVLSPWSNVPSVM